MAVHMALSQHEQKMLKLSHSRALLSASLAVLTLSIGCESDPTLSNSGRGDGGAANKVDPEGGSVINIGEGDGGAGGGSTKLPNKQKIEILEELPDGFVEADEFGGWDVVGALDSVTTDADRGCANVLRVIARDFSHTHSDFEEGSTGLLAGIVEDELGDDRKPIYAGQPNDKVTSSDSFDEWYRNVEGVNQPFVLDMWMEPVDDTFVFHSSTFFPLVGHGYGAEACSGDCNGEDEGFHFTTELHTNFQYQGGEEFTFIGDDDVWVFINGRLAMDLGGVHGKEPGTVLLDDLGPEFGLEVGKVYPIDLFQAERQQTQSNFRIETTLDFTDCGEILPVDIK